MYNALLYIGLYCWLFVLQGSCPWHHQKSSSNSCRWCSNTYRHLSRWTNGVQHRFHLQFHWRNVLPWKSDSSSKNSLLHWWNGYGLIWQGFGCQTKISAGGDIPRRSDAVICENSVAFDLTVGAYRISHARGISCSSFCHCPLVRLALNLKWNTNI